MNVSKLLGYLVVRDESTYLGFSSCLDLVNG